MQKLFSKQSDNLLLLFLMPINRFRQIIPFIIPGIRMLHLIPDKPRSHDTNRRANGMYRQLHVTLITAGGMVRPIP